MIGTSAEVAQRLRTSVPNLPDANVIVKHGRQCQEAQMCSAYFHRMADVMAS